MTTICFIDTECPVEGCHEPRRSKGMCNPHYQRQHRTGSPGSAPPLVEDLPDNPFDEPGGAR